VSDGDALLAAILADPKEDTPRLVYADWLAENEQEKRAEFVRVQVELAKRASSKGPPLVKIDEKPQKCKKCKAWYGGLGLCGCKYGQRRSENWERLRNERNGWVAENQLLMNRQHELIQDHGYGFVDGAIGSKWDTKGIIKTTASVTVQYVKKRNKRETDPVLLLFHRGFVFSLKCAWELWRANAGAILKRNPIEKVRLKTSPQASGYTWRWTENDGVVTCDTWPGIEFELPQDSQVPYGIEYWMGAAEVSDPHQPFFVGLAEEPS
jgi:uncharacterized protein (TIGR02996 family)